ncbi:type IX secretion system motor protein PorM/GldM [Luteibaculum oceani]|uniref:Gliding motility protein GldM n=1 Tax=Luteibaculum oceani TaxID=1294296 RepID=A0A5C6V219_9FLAO|nr:gliding motility protein GldM [Luteibaculum oceani]TXC78850.1 gliding motility protein GldM [Luteibaculum oceani]
MAGGKETPRQKMIGMMYLVLTALLALNVSKDILDAFAIIDEGIEKSTSSFQDKIDGQMSDFLASYNENQKKVEPYYQKAKKVETLANDLHQYINTMKAKVIAYTNTQNPENFQEYMGKNASGRDTVLGIEYIEKKDDYDSPGFFLLGPDPAKKLKEDEHSAKALQNEMLKFRDELINMVKDDPQFVERLQEEFKFEGGKDKSGVKMEWASLTFYHQTVAATLTMLSKMQADVRTAESDVIAYLYQSVDAASFKFNKLMAVVNTQSNYIAVGDSFRADVFLAAYDSTKFPEIKIGSDYDQESRQFKGEPVDIDVVDGVGKIRMKGTTTGEKTWKGVINYEVSGGRTVPYPFEFTFKVSDADAVIDPSKMNVFYKGLDNPVSVSVPGADSDKLRVTCNVAGVKIKPDPAGGAGKYLINVPGSVDARECKLIVSAENVSGNMKQAGEKTFRIKKIPPPTPFFMGKKPTDNVIPLVALTTGDEIKCILEDFLFEGVQFKVTKFSLSMTKGGNVVNFDQRGNKIGGEVKRALSEVRKNQIVTFNNIWAIGPDGEEKKLANLSFKVI